MDLISIIIPVYNTGSYLTRCIGSVIKQTYTQLEIIIVDDGSSQETALLCDQLATSDSRIKLYHKTNEGVSKARNFGLKHARGKYIGFVDSDDWISPDMYKTLHDNAIKSNADIVYCDAQTIWDDGRTEKDTWTTYSDSLTLSTVDITPVALIQMAGSAWRGLFKKSVGTNIQFPEGLKFSEDRYYNLQWIAASKTISYIKAPFYFRFMRSDSCVNSYHSDAIKTIRTASDLINSFVAEHFGLEYQRIYEQQSFGLTLQCFYSIFASNLSFWEKYHEVKNIASDHYLRNVVNRYRPTDLRLRLMRYKLYFPLYLLIWTHNRIKK